MGKTEKGGNSKTTDRFSTMVGNCAILFSWIDGVGKVIVFSVIEHDICLVSLFAGLKIYLFCLYCMTKERLVGWQSIFLFIETGKLHLLIKKLSQLP